MRRSRTASTHREIRRLARQETITAEKLGLPGADESTGRQAGANAADGTWVRYGLVGVTALDEPFYVAPGPKDY